MLSTVEKNFIPFSQSELVNLVHSKGFPHLLSLGKHHEAKNLPRESAAPFISIFLLKSGKRIILAQ
jgi:hypothetical protein